MQQGTSGTPAVHSSTPDESEWSQLINVWKECLNGVFGVAAKILPDGSRFPIFLFFLKLSDGTMKEEHKTALFVELGQKLEQFETVCDEIYALLVFIEYCFLLMEEYNKSILKIKSTMQPHANESPESLQQIAAQVDQSRDVINQFKRELQEISSLNK
jgi:hypothetical protein